MDDIETNSPNEHLIELDSRRRASLGRIGRPEHRLYLAHEETDGTIILTPAAAVPASAVPAGGSQP